MPSVNQHGRPFPTISKYKGIFVVIRIGVSLRSFLPMSELAELGQEVVSRQADGVLDSLRKSQHSTQIPGREFRFLR